MFKHIGMAGMFALSLVASINHKLDCGYACMFDAICHFVINLIFLVWKGVMIDVWYWIFDVLYQMQPFVRIMNDTIHCSILKLLTMGTICIKTKLNTNFQSCPWFCVTLAVHHIFMHLNSLYSIDYLWNESWMFLCMLGK